MKTLKDELKELQILLNNPTPENEMLYQKKFIEIKNKFSSKEDANIIASQERMARIVCSISLSNSQPS